MQRTDLHYWQLKDRVWLERRKAQWNDKVKYCFRDFPRSWLNDLRDYYIKGQLPKETGKLQLDHSDVSLCLIVHLHPGEGDDFWTWFFQQPKYWARNEVPPTTDEIREALQGLIVSTDFAWQGRRQQAIEYSASQIYHNADFQFDAGDVRGDVFGADDFFGWNVAHIEKWLLGEDELWVDFDTSLRALTSVWPHISSNCLGMYDPTADNFDGVGIYGVLLILARFINPTSLADRDSAQKRAVSKLIDFLLTRERGEGIRAMWADVNRPEFWEAWARLRIEEGSNVSMQPYVCVAGLNDAALELPERVQHACNALGFSTQRFEAGNIRAVDASTRFCEEYRTLAGYPSPLPFPAFSYQINTNSTFTTTNLASVHLEVLLPVFTQGADESDICRPMIWLRPEAPYDIWHESAYQFRMHVRQILIHLEQHYGMVFREVFLGNCPGRFDLHFEEYYLAAYDHLIPEWKKADLPDWQGEPLNRS